MVKYVVILLFCLLAGTMGLQAGESRTCNFDFYGIPISAPVPATTVFQVPLSEQSIQQFYADIESEDYTALVDLLKAEKQRQQMSDWLYYQLIRKTAEQLSPKSKNYNQYTLYKWLLLCKSGYDAKLAIFKDELLFYIQCDEDIYDIPYFVKDNKQYVCLNIHDYGKINFEEDELLEVRVKVPNALSKFSYKVAQLPDFKEESYTSKDISFKYKNKKYHFEMLVNKELNTIFKNYPVVDYASYFNIPISNKTYNSLIPELKKNIARLDQQEGVEYLMEFTRNAFAFETDQQNFGKEKRLSPELTLSNDYSDCDDRAALFFYLVKEIYDLPMIALLYPTHVTIAVKLDKPAGEPIEYNGQLYSVCEPTPQQESLRIGELSSKLKATPYQVAYVYNP